MYKHKSAFFSHSKGVYVSKKKIWEKKKKFSKQKANIMPNVKGKKYGCIVIDSRFITKNGRRALKSVLPLFLK